MNERPVPSPGTNASRVALWVVILGALAMLLSWLTRWPWG
jgi:hypothetical protein